VPGKRIVTLVFTDMEGSTPLLGALGDAFLPVLERQRAILGTVAAGHGGTGYATGGDGCVFLFRSASGALAAAEVDWSLVLPSTRRSAETSVGRNDRFATSKSTVSVPHSSSTA
jgi:class 3 adenylate cyclase